MVTVYLEGFINLDKFNLEKITDLEVNFRRTKVMSSAPVLLTPQRRHAMIAEAAYYLAQQRNFQQGDPLQDWLQAEIVINQKWQTPKLALRHLSEPETTDVTS